MPVTVRPGQILEGRYLLIDVIGHGGMSTVWRARDERLGRIAAVKVLDPDRIADADLRSRLRTEAQSLARLHHPYIADVYDYGVDDIPYLVMELVDGVPVSAALTGGTALPWIEAVSIAAQAAAALAAAHRRGIVHRDIAAGNILLTADGVKIIDFGICATEGNLDADQGALLVGTPAYLAPERIAGQPVQPESDVYALGILLYRMISGDFPFAAANARELMNAHRRMPPPPLPRVTGMPAIVADICAQCLGKDAAIRPTASELSRSLFDILGGAATISIPMPSTTADDGLSTHVLPWLDGAPRARTPVAARFSRRAKTTTGAAGILLALAAAWMVNGWNSTGITTPPVAAGPAALQPFPATTTCAVTYQLLRDDGSSYAAAVTVANVSSRDLAGVQLNFVLPGTQQLVDNGLWEQDGQVARTVPGLLNLRAGNGVRLPLAGTYAGPNAYPLTFRVDSQPCSVSILGPGGVPVTSSASSGPSQPPVIIVDISPWAPAKTQPSPAGSTAPPLPSPQPEPSASTPGGSGPGVPPPSPPPKPSKTKPPRPSNTPRSGVTASVR